MAIHSTIKQAEIKRIRKALDELLKAMEMNPLPEWADGIEISFVGFKDKILSVDGKVTNRQFADLGNH